MINARAVATLGIGFGPIPVSTLGFYYFEEFSQAQLVANAIRNQIIGYINLLTQQVTYTLEIYKVNGLHTEYPLSVTQNLRRVEEINQQIITSIEQKSSTMTRIQ